MVVGSWTRRIFRRRTEEETRVGQEGKSHCNKVSKMGVWLNNGSIGV